MCRKKKCKKQKRSAPREVRTAHPATCELRGLGRERAWAGEERSEGRRPPRSHGVEEGLRGTELRGQKRGLISAFWA